MKKIKGKAGRKFLSWMLVLLLIGSSMSYSTEAKAAKKVKLNKKTVSLRVGKTVKLKLKNNKKKIKWSSSKKKIAKVSKKGVVKALKKGKTKITAKVGKKKYVCKVTVLPKKKAAAKAPAAPVRKPVRSATPIPPSDTIPTVAPTTAPTTEPSIAPTAEPSVAPTEEPTASPTTEPSIAPTAEPTVSPTVEPSVAPTVEPTVSPTAEPSVAPTEEPTASPTVVPTVKPTVSPTVAPTAEPVVTGTAFRMGSVSVQLGMTESQVRTILGSGIQRTDTSPQGFSNIVYNPSGSYSEYMIVQIADGVVAGICGISANMSYGDLINAGTGGTVLQSSGWASVNWYSARKSGTKVGAGAYSIEVEGAEVIAFVDYYGDNTTYCIQVFSDQYFKNNMFYPETAGYNYTDAAKQAVTTETLELLNAYCKYYGIRTLAKGPKATTVAQAYSDSLAAAGVSEAASRNSDTVFNALYDGGLDPMCWAESVLMGNSDAIGFANSIIESAEARKYVIGNYDDMEYTHVGVGFSTVPGSGQYKTYLVIDYYSL